MWPINYIHLRKNKLWLKNVWRYIFSSFPAEIRLTIRSQKLHILFQVYVISLKRFAYQLGFTFAAWWTEICVEKGLMREIRVKLKRDSTCIRSDGDALRVKCFRFEVLQRPPELFRGKLLSSIHYSDATVAGFLTHSFMHLQLFHDAFDVTGVACGLACTWMYKSRHNTPPQIHPQAGLQVETRLPLFPPFRGLLLSFLFIQCLLDGWITFRGNLFSSKLTPSISLHFSPSATANHGAANHSANVLSVLLSPFVIAARENAAKERKRRSRRRWNELIDRANRKRNTRGIRSIFFVCKLS